MFVSSKKQKDAEEKLHVGKEHLNFLILFRSGIIVATLTFISRVFGLGRELFVASLFGTTYTADAVNVAFKFPNLFRRIFAEGALSIVFIPIFSKKMLNSHNVARKFASDVFVLLLLTLILLVIVMQIMMPYLMFIIAPGFHLHPEKFNLTILLCRITMPYLIFISVTALFGGILNSMNRFAAFAFSPIILSISVIIGTMILKHNMNAAIAISLSIVIAGVLQVFFIYYCMIKAKINLSLSFKTMDQDVSKLMGNMLPATMSAGVQQLNLFISQSIASFIPGAVSILTYADRLYQFPLSIIGVTLGTILLPELSKIYTMHDKSKAIQLQNNAIRVGYLLSLPAACGILLLSQPIIHIIYQRGVFTFQDTINTSNALSMFALGLPGFIISKILIPIFYANGDTKTPLKITINSLIANIILNFILIILLGYIGIALGSAIATWYHVWLLHKYSRKHGLFFVDKDMWVFCIKVLFSTIVMGLVITILNYYCSAYLFADSILIKIITLTFTIVIGMVIFFIMIITFQIHKVLWLY